MGGVSGEFNFCQVLLLLLLDAVAYGVVAWYVELVLPGGSGVPKPWYFLAMVSTATAVPKTTLDLLQPPPYLLPSRWCPDGNLKPQDI